METIGKRISRLRREAGYTQDTLADVLGITPQAISKWECDITCPDISLLPALAKALGVTTDELLSGKSESEPAVKIVPKDERRDIGDMMLKIVVDSNDGDKVRVNIPMALVQVALEMGMELPQVSNKDCLRGIDLGEIVNLVKAGAVGNLVEVESSDGDVVRIFVE